MSGRHWRAVVAGIGLLLGCRAPRHDATSAEVAALLATDRDWAKLSAVGKDVDSISSYWTDDARVVGTGQPVVSGKPAIREMVTGMMKIPGFHISWSPDSAVISRSGDLGYTFGTNEVTVPDSAGKLITASGRYLTVWRKGADGRWRCVEDFSNSAPVLR
ncbi:MAG: YybH family protein [Gemmatimonadales bacterium]